MKEEFRYIEGYEGLYQVSNLGRVKSLSRLRTNGGWIKERILKAGVAKGYKIVVLFKGGKRKCIKVHKLVAMTFLKHKPCGLKEVVDHIDNDKLNNRLDNLQLITNRENLSKDKKNGSSKYIGVDWENSRGKWRSKIRILGKQILLGRYKDEYEAHLQYQKALNNLDKYNNNPKEFRDYLTQL